MAEPTESGGALERFVPQGELDQRQVEDLASVGLSPAFPDRVRELNEGLVWFGKGSFKGFKFSLSPDEKHPKVEVQARHVFPFIVEVDAHTDLTAALTIVPKYWEVGAALHYLRLDQLREFTDDYPTDETIMLRAKHKPASYARSTDPSIDEVPPKKYIEDIVVPVVEVNSTGDLEDLGVAPIHFELDIGFVGRAASLAITMGYGPDDRVDQPVFRLMSLEAKDTAQNIEAVVGALGRLLKKHFLHRGDID